MQTAYCTLQTPNCTLFTVEYNGYFKVTLRGKYIPLKVGEEKSKVTKKKGNIFTPEIIDQSMMEKAWVPPYPPLICTGCPSTSYVQAYVQGYVRGYVHAYVQGYVQGYASLQVRCIFYLQRTRS